jgi:hypothetical protein
VTHRAAARTPARRPSSETEEIERIVAEAEATAIVIWRGAHLRLADVPEQVARISVRQGRELLYGSYVDALEAMNPLYARRLDAWIADGATAAELHGDPGRLLADLARLGLHLETPYYAALRRYLALIGIEQGDASEADLWHVVRGTSWAPWFGERESARALAATVRGGGGSAPGHGGEGWRGTEAALRSAAPGAASAAGAVVGGAYATLVGSPEWLSDELHVNPEGVAQFVDFAAFVRLWRLRRQIALLTYEERLFAAADPGLQRAYYAGIVGHHTGVAVAEAGYLAAVPRPYASAHQIRAEVAAGMLVDVLERRHGPRWWRDPESARLLDRVAAAASVEDAVAELGYDGLDWRPVLRQIRTRLIGEMSGYGGPNITTRAGTRKV